VKNLPPQPFPQGLGSHHSIKSEPRAKTSGGACLPEDLSTASCHRFEIDGGLEMNQMADNFSEFGDAFAYVRIVSPADIPPIDARFLDVALLDMHHKWSNLGHDSLVRAIGEIALDLHPLLRQAGLKIRAFSYDVRQSLMVPEASDNRHLLFIGTGGPGHIDPHRNDGVSEWTQGIREDPSWEKPLFRLFESILKNEQAAFLAVCHSFGVLCRWSGVARPELRGPGKGGKSSGIMVNTLTPEAEQHPWFRRFAAELPDWKHHSVLDSRLFDLIPGWDDIPDDITPLAYECDPENGERGEAITMLEFARDRGGVMPRILGVNHHPEIHDRKRQRHLLDLKFQRGEVTADWYEERTRTLNQAFDSWESERRILLTSWYTLLAPLRFYLCRLVRVRAQAMGCETDLHESQVIHLPSGILDRKETF
jgi:hypothetical protein